MDIAAIALGLNLTYLVVTFGVRGWLLYRSAGTTGFRGLSGRVGSAAWWSGVLFALALIAGLVAPALQMTGVLDPIAVLDSRPLLLLGGLLVVLGAAGSWLAQSAMGDTWRVGVEASEVTDLVRGGVFGAVRNPFFTALLGTAIGLTLLTPNPLALLALTGLGLAVQLQVRAVEEPHLLAVHGDVYRRYAHAVGRFWPGLGRLRVTGQGGTRRGRSG